jgi:hypothetical protein
MYLGSVAEFLSECGCSRRLNKFAKARARIRESPRGDFNFKTVENLCGLIEERGFGWIHDWLPAFALQV